MYSSLPVFDPPHLPGVPARLGAWQLAGSTEVPNPYSGQGIATVSRPGGRTELVYDGDRSLTSSLLAEGWDHVGDPDGWGGWVVTPYQGGPGIRSKMFQATSPAGVVTRSVHPLARGEIANNSFAAVSPDGHWTVSGEWGVESRLLVFPTPGVAWPAGRPLALAGTISLDQPVSDIQGCAFATGASLVCTDGSQVLEFDLDRPVGRSAGGPVGGQVGAPGGGQGGAVFARASLRVLGPVPEVGGCRGDYEPEGVDVDRALGQLRLEVTQPGLCAALTQVYEYTRR